MTDVKTSIEQRRCDLEQHDRDLRTAALKAVSEQTYPMLKALRDECGKTGHQWKFSHWNWDQTCQWDKCVWCGFGEPVDAHLGRPAS